MKALLLSHGADLWPPQHAQAFLQTPEGRLTNPLALALLGSPTHPEACSDPEPQPFAHGPCLVLPPANQQLSGMCAAHSAQPIKVVVTESFALQAALLVCVTVRKTRYSTLVTSLQRP